MITAAVVNIFDQSRGILFVLYEIHLPQTDAGLQLCPQCARVQWERCNLQSVLPGEFPCSSE